MTKPQNIRHLHIGDFHVVPLKGLSPVAIKDAAKKLIKDREPISHVKTQNSVIRELGFKAGIAEYKSIYKEKLIPFMQKHGLKKQRNLLNADNRNRSLVRISAQRLSECLFSEDTKSVTKVLSGHIIPWDVVTDYYIGDSSEHNTARPLTHKDHIVETLRECGLKDDGSHREEHLSLVYEMHSTISGHIFHEDEVEVGSVVHLYKPSEMDPCLFKQEREKTVNALKRFQEWTTHLPYAWLEVIRFNDNLIFLKSQGGSYEILVRGAKDRPFEHNIFSPFLGNGDVPKSNDTYHFQRWLYFEYDGWLERDEHLAEEDYYKNEGTSKAHPGQTEILRKWLIKKGTYKQPAEAKRQSDGFFRFTVGDTKLYVSNLITIEELRIFMNSGNPEYTAYRNKLKDNADLVEPNNNALDLPAAATWYDANAYATWISKSRDLPVRLLEESEYEQIYRSVTEADRFDGWHSDPAYTKPEIQYEWLEHESGYKLARSGRFGEWLNKRGSAVNTAYLGSLCYPQSQFTAERAPFCAHSTGEYKGMRIGFRLCYLAKD